MRPKIGGIVHYSSFGSPVRPDGTQVYTGKCRAAVVTEIKDDTTVGLCVLNPEGIFLRTLAAGGCFLDGMSHAGGTWHYELDCTE